MKNLILVTAALAVGCLSTLARAADKDELESKLKAATKKATAQDYQLRYKFQPEQTISYKVVHLVTVRTTVKGTTQTAKTRSVSTKVWVVSDTDADGNATFVHKVADVDMWQQVSGQQEIRFNSRAGEEEVPPEYQAVAESVGVPLAVITLSPTGVVVHREAKHRQMNLGMGGVAVPLPAESIPIGHIWSQPHELQAKLKDGRIKKVKARDVYKLTGVATGVATILVQTQLLTPIDDPAVRSQLIQRMSSGTIKFDMDAGRVIGKQMDWDENVVGFNGVESNMQYLARFTEELLPDAPARVAEKKPQAQPAQSTLPTLR